MGDTAQVDWRNDPGFSQLSLADKHAVLLRIDPDYAALPAQAQVQALNSIHYGAAPDPGLGNTIADRIDQGRGVAERGVTSFMQNFGLPTNPDEARHFVGQDPGQKPAIVEMIKAGPRALPVVGPSIKASEDVQAGRYPEAVGDIAAGVAGAAPFSGIAGRAGTGLGQRIAAATRTPEGELGPITKGASRVAGAAAGYGMTPKNVPPYYGAAGGATMGPLLADRIIPKVTPKYARAPMGAYAEPPEPLTGQVTKVSESPGLYRGPSQVDLAQRTATRAVEASRAPIPISEGPTAQQHAAVRGAQADVAGRNARQFVPVSESPSSPPTTRQGGQPTVTKVPVPSGQQAKVTVEQVPGPDTPGKGNLLTPAAKRGVPGAGEELVRRGRPVLFTPETGYAPPKSVTKLSERVPTGESPTLKQRTGYKPSEKATSMSEKPRDLGPSWNAEERQSIADRLYNTLESDAATAEEKTIARQSLQDLGLSETAGQTIARKMALRRPR